MHFLVIPKARDGLTQLSKATERQEQLLGHLLIVASKVAKHGALSQSSPAAAADAPRRLLVCVSGRRAFPADATAWQATAARHPNSMERHCFYAHLPTPWTAKAS